jgi:hypothetical protein
MTCEETMMDPRTLEFRTPAEIQKGRPGLRLNVPAVISALVAALVVAFGSRPSIVSWSALGWGVATAVVTYWIEARFLRTMFQNSPPIMTLPTGIFALFFIPIGISTIFFTLRQLFG